MEKRPSCDELERRVAELEAELSRYRTAAVKYRTLFETFPHGITVSDDRGRIVETNAVAEQLLGVTRAEHERRSLDGAEWRIIRPDGSPMPPGEWASVVALRERRTVSDCEMGIVRPDGETTWIDVTAAPLPIEGYGVVVTYGDVTARKRAEEDLRRSRTELRRTLEATTDGIWTWDFRSGALSFSPRYYTMLGYAPDAFPADYEHWAALIHPDDRESAVAAAERYLETKPDVYENEFRLRTRDGDYRWIRTLARVVERGEDGEARIMIGNHEDITARKLAEQAYTEASRRLREVIRGANVGLWDWDLVTDRVRYSAEWKRQIGYRDDEIGDGYHEWESRLHPDDLEPTLRKVRQAIADASPSSQWEFRFRHRDGSWRWILVQASVHCDQNGKAARVLGSHIDITKQKEQEEALRLQSLVLDQIHDHVTVTDLDGTITYVNQAQVETLGMPKEALVGRSTAVYGEEAERGATQREILARTLEEGAWRGEVVNRDRDGREHVMDCRTRLIVDEQGRPTALCGIATDISDYRNAMERLRRSEARYRVFFEEGPDGVVILDPATGAIVEFNDRACAQLGYSREAFAALRVADLEVDESPEEIVEHMGRVMRDGRDDFETRHRTRTGEIRWVHVTAQLIRTGEEAIYLCLWRDITARRQLESRLQQAQKMEAIGSLAGGIAHDFNNILFPILGMSEMLMEDLPPGSPAQQNVREIHAAGKRGGELVRQILAFSRQSEHKLIPVAIQQVLKEVLRLARRTIPADIEITRDIQSDCGLVLSDPTQVHQIAMNLITNAFHAVESTGGRIAVSLREDELPEADAHLADGVAGRCAVLTVADTGGGIEADHLEKIFDPYFTTKAPGKGTGLGLATVYGIVKEHRGDIEVESEVGQGAVFHVYLPLIEKPPPAAVPETMAAHPTGDERILLVDDEPAIVRLVKQMLERLGYRVTERHGSIDALALFSGDPSAFDLVLTDMNMPGMTGEQLAERVIAARPDIPVVICTGFSERIDRKKAAALGIRGFLMKPVVTSDLARTVREALDTARSCE